MRISWRTRCARKDNRTSTRRDHPEPGQANPPGATRSLLRGGHAVFRSGPRGVAPTPPGARRRAHRATGLHGSHAIARPDSRFRGAVTAAQCGSARVGLIGGGSCPEEAHENRSRPPRGCQRCRLSWVRAGGGPSTPTSCAPWTASRPSRSSTTAKSARARSCRPCAGPGLHQVARGSAAHRRARRGHTTGHTPANRPGGDPCTARRRRRTPSASPFTSRASTSERPSALLQMRIP